MLAIERKKFILKYLEEHGNVTTNELCGLLSVSPATARNDLNKLEKDNLILKTHGGATLLSGQERLPQSGFYFDERQRVNAQEKEAISELALEMIEDNQCIILDASSTAVTLAKRLGRFSRLIVVTNGIYTMLALKDNPNITVIFVGGIVTTKSGSTEGLMGKDILSHVNADLAFMSARGFTLKEGLTDFNYYEAELKKEMLCHSRKCVALMDSTKLECVSTASFCNTDQVDVLITDSKADKEALDSYRDAGMTVKISPVNI